MNTFSYTLRRISSFSIALAFMLCLSLQLQAQGNNFIDSNYLDVSIEVFNPNITDNEQSPQASRIYPQIRMAESRYFPFFLREKLVTSMLWGAVRVIPGKDPGAELLISGEIIESNGNRLVLQIIVQDGRGVEWFNTLYQASDPVFAEQLNSETLYDPFQSLYFEIISDLETVLSSISASAITTIKNVSLLRYAARLSPEAFNSFIQVQADGTLGYDRLPATNDPLLTRVIAIRDHEYLFIDTVDEQYRTYFQSMKPLYDLWRQYSYEQILQLENFDDRVENRQNRLRQGTYLAYRQSYNNFRFQKLEEQYLDELSLGFDNELNPTTIALEDRMVNLNGTLEAQYAEWREIIKSFYRLEPGTIEFEKTLGNSEILAE